MSDVAQEVAAVPVHEDKKPEFPGVKPEKTWRRSAAEGGKTNTDHVVTMRSTDKPDRSAEQRWP